MVHHSGLLQRCCGCPFWHMGDWIKSPITKHRPAILKGDKAMAGKDETQLYEVSGPTFNPPSSALEVLSWAPAWLTGSERLLLFTLIYSLRPERYLEIGTLQGGSALIVSAAMDAFDSP